MTQAAGTQAPASGAQGTPPAASAQGAKTVEELKTELQNKNAAITEARETARALKEELEILKAAGSGGRAPAAPAHAGNDPLAETAQRLSELWESDPRRAMQTELQMALRWYDQSNSQVDSQADEIAKKFADFNTYRSDVLRYLRTLPMENRNRPGVVEAAYFYVKGQKVDDLINLSKEQLIAKLRAGEKVQGLEGMVASGAPAPKANEPSADQIKAAGAMGMTIEEYMKNVR